MRFSCSLVLSLLASASAVQGIPHKACHKKGHSSAAAYYHDNPNGQGGYESVKSSAYHDHGAPRASTTSLYGGYWPEDNGPYGPRSSAGSAAFSKLPSAASSSKQHYHVPSSLSISTGDSSVADLSPTSSLYGISHESSSFAYAAPASSSFSTLSSSFEPSSTAVSQATSTSDFSSFASSMSASSTFSRSESSSSASIVFERSSSDISSSSFVESITLTTSSFSAISTVFSSSSEIVSSSSSEVESSTLSSATSSEPSSSLVATSSASSESSSTLASTSSFSSVITSSASLTSSLTSSSIISSTSSSTSSISTSCCGPTGPCHLDNIFRMRYSDRPGGPSWAFVAERIVSDRNDVEYITFQDAKDSTGASNPLAGSNFKFVSDGSTCRLSLLELPGFLSYVSDTMGADPNTPVLGNMVFARPGTELATPGRVLRPVQCLASSSGGLACNVVGTGRGGPWPLGASLTMGGDGSQTDAQFIMDNVNTFPCPSGPYFMRNDLLGTQGLISFNRLDPHESSFRINLAPSAGITPSIFTFSRSDNGLCRMRSGSLFSSSANINTVPNARDLYLIESGGFPSATEQAPMYCSFDPAGNAQLVCRSGLYFRNSVVDFSYLGLLKVGDAGQLTSLTMMPVGG